MKEETYFETTHTRFIFLDSSVSYFQLRFFSGYRGEGYPKVEMLRAMRPEVTQGEAWNGGKDPQH